MKKLKADPYLKLVEVALEAGLSPLQQAGERGDLQRHPAHAVRLPDLRQDLRVEVDKQLPGLGGADQ